MNYSEKKKVYCNECGRDVTERQQYYDQYHSTLCKDCLLMLHKKEVGYGRRENVRE
jgi:NAD-dependent SIR2 family protein deacetylase